MAQLDKSRPFGEVIGHRFQKYEQDNKSFNGAGEECDENGVVVEDETSTAPAPIPEPEQTAPTQTGQPVEPTMEHRGGGWYNVFDTKGELVGEDFKKVEAIAKVEELKFAAAQMQAALQDG